MDQAHGTRAGLSVAFGGLLAASTAALSACAPTSCSAVKVADDFTIIAVSAAHTHPLLSLCEPANCTPPLNAASRDRGASVGPSPSLALYATSADHWRVSVREDRNGHDDTDPSSVSVALYDRTTRLLTRTIHPAWHPAPGTCSDFNTANTVRIATQ